MPKVFNVNSKVAISDFKGKEVYFTKLLNEEKKSKLVLEESGDVLSQASLRTHQKIYVNWPHPTLDAPLG